MSIFRQRDSLNWLSFFSVKNEKEKLQFLNHIKEMKIDYSSQWLAEEMLRLSGRSCSEYRTDDPCMQTACEHVALKFMLHDSDLAKDLLSEEEFIKANEVYSRKQYNSKLLKKLLCIFLSMLLEKGSEDSLNNLFTLSILDELYREKEAEIERSFGILKKVIDKVTSGVKSSCYFDANTYHHLEFYSVFNEALNDFIIDHFNYDFNKAKNLLSQRYSSLLLCQQANIIDNSLLRKALLNDENFWKEHENFCIVKFINAVEKHNDLRHAEKLLLYIFENLKVMPNMNIVFDNQFPLYMSMYDEILNDLEDHARSITFARLGKNCDTSVLDSLSFCYPMNTVDETRFEIGKRIWDKFICEYNYPHDKEKVTNYLENKVNSFISENISSYYEIGVVLDCGPFKFTDKDDYDRKLLRAYQPDCFAPENIWKRVYLKAHAVTLLSDDEETQLTYLQRIFIDLIKALEHQLGVCTAHQLDRSSRTKYYQLLKEKIKSFGIETNDTHQEDYIISLLDRDTATVSEYQRFPELEQLGDAIYGLAVAELLFYNPKTCLPWNTEKKMSQLFEDYTRAEAQVAISKKHGFDKLFLHLGFPAKYIEYESIFSDIENSHEVHFKNFKEKYLADSLEMIIASICRDKGIDVAIKFTKELLKQTFPKTFSSEIHPTEENKPNTDIEWDYWARILPAPRTVMESEHRVLWNALHKVVMTLSLGTDDKEKRNYISHSFGNTAIYGDPDSYDISWVFYDYLQSGLDTVLKKYGDKVRESYKNKVK